MKSAFQMAGLILIVAAGFVTTAGAQDIVGEHIKAIGSQTAVEGIKTLERSGTVELGGMLGNLKGTFKDAALIGKKSYALMDLQLAVEETGWNGEFAWKRDMEQGLRKIDGEEAEQAQMRSELDPIAALNRQYGLLAFNATDDEMLDGRNCKVLEIVDTELTFYIDAETKMISAMKAAYEDPDFGPGELVVKFSDYTEHAGVKLPGKMQINIGDGAIVIDYTYEKTTINEPIDDALFAMPAQ